ncbi:MAG: hypothetical protein ABSD46_11990 [Bacteroidota bacterium]
MFESICIRHQSNLDTKNPIDLGFLAEALLFYSDVVVLAKQDILRQLINKCGPDIVLQMLEAGFIKIKYEHQQTAIHTQNTGSSHERHSGIYFHSPEHALQEIAPKIFTEVTGKSGRGRRLGFRFCRFVDTIQPDTTMLSNFNSDVLDKAFIETAVVKLLSYCAPEYKLPQPLTFDVHLDNNELIVETNINFIDANKSYHLHIPPSHSSLSNAYILAHILTTRENLSFSSILNADLALDSLNSQLLVTKVNSIFNRYDKSMNQIRLFQDFVIENGKAIREAINSGHRTFADLLKLLEKAQKFRDWLKDKPQDVNLVKEYFKEVTQSSWIDNLPGKTFRWSLFTSAGMALDALGGSGIGTAMGLTLSAADAFVMDKIIKG